METCRTRTGPSSPVAPGWKRAKSCSMRIVIGCTTYPGVLAGGGRLDRGFGMVMLVVHSSVRREGGNRVQRASRATMLHYARCRCPFPGRVPGSPRWMALRDAMQCAMLALQVAMTGLSGVPGCSNAHVHHLEIVCIKWSEPSAKGLFSFSSVSFGVA